MEQIERILAEIHRLKNELEGYSAQEVLDYIESYINIISREQPLLEDSVAFQRGVQEGRRLEREDNLTIAEAAKDFTVALVSSGSGLNPKTIAYAIEMADELIKQLKEK